jgi:class 3 adenylate cyclase/esterase/lipase
VRAPETKYARSGDLSIAYQVTGTGPPDIVAVPGFISHVELNWESPFYGEPFERLARMGRLVSFDKRGVGLSDRVLGFGTLEQRMDDIRAVLDAADVERASFVAVSEGGPLAIMFAATYPERVEKLVLYATFARLLVDDDYPIGRTPDDFEAFADFIEVSWGSGDALAQFVQHVDDDAAARPFLARLERYTASPAMAANVLRDYGLVDVRPLLPAIRVPTAVVHTKGDPIVPARLGRYLAQHIAGARMVEIDDGFHACWDRARHDLVMDPIIEFIAGRTDHDVDLVDRVLTTVLFTDIVDSTARASHLGDARWRALLDRHDGIVREEIERFRGREVKTTGDGFLVTFDGPARAVRAAQSISSRVAAAGLEMRAGVHTGECELRGDDVAGVAVHVGARVMSLADAGEVYVSRTVRDLVVGSGIVFAPRGTHQLKGVADPMELFAVSG